MKLITKSVIWIVVFLAGCGDGVAPNAVSKAPDTTRIEIASTSGVQNVIAIASSPVVSTVSEVQEMVVLPPPPDACASQADTSGRQMGGARQCVSLSAVDNTQSTSTMRNGIPASFTLPTDITTDGSNLYVVDTFSNKVRKVEIATGEVTTLAGSGARGAADGIGVVASFNEPVSITTDGNNLYVSDRENHKIRKIEIATAKVTTLAGSETYKYNQNCGKAAVGFCFLGGLTTDGSYVYVNDIGNKKICKIDLANGQVSTLAGSGESIAKDGLGEKASFFENSGITTDGKYLYVVDTNYDGTSNILRKVNIANGSVGTLTNFGQTLGFFKPLIGITTVGNYLYVTSSDHNGVYRVNVESGQKVLLAGSGKAIEAAGGTGKEASFSKPLGITSDGRNLYVADSYNRKIRKIEIASGLVTTLAGSSGASERDGVGMTGYDLPSSGIATDGNSLFVSDPSNSTIRKIDLATVVVSTFAGSGEMKWGDGVGLSASFNLAKGMTVSGGNLYISDHANHAIRKIEIETGMVTTLAGSGKEGAKDGTSKAASFSNPRGVVVVGGHLYVADTFNHKVRKIVVATGKVETLAGAGVPGLADGVGKKALFSTPSALVSDGNNLYVADTLNHAIRKIVIATGQVTTLAGSGKEGMADGTGEAASFNQPLDIAINGGSLYVADSGNHLIRKIELSSGAVTTLVLKGKSQQASTAR